MNQINEEEEYDLEININEDDEALDNLCHKLEKKINIKNFIIY